MTALPPLFAALQDIIRADEPVQRRLCPACRGTMESHSAERDGTCMKCDDGYLPEPEPWDDEPPAEEVAELKAIQLRYWGF